MSNQKYPDYSFMKSGFNTLHEPDPTIDNDDFISMIVSLITVFTDNSVKTSITYVKHANRNGITKKDISNALKYEVSIFLSRNDTFEKISNEIKIIKKKIEDNTYDINDTIDDEIDINDEGINDYSKCKCNCDLCTGVNKAVDTWADWIPQTMLETILKEKINDIDNDLN